MNSRYPNCTPVLAKDIHSLLLETKKPTLSMEFSTSEEMGSLSRMKEFTRKDWSPTIGQLPFGYVQATSH
jgi:hypothetical protein